jgi:hypothetical protein
MNDPVSSRVPSSRPGLSGALQAAAVAVATVVLFLWSGLTQMFPWGVPTVQNVAQTSGDPDAFGATLTRLPPGALATPRFDVELGDGISTLTTDRSFAWIVSVPIERYDPVRYFATELATQAMCALVLVLALRLSSPLPRREGAGLVALFAVGASAASYGVMANWWGLPLLYAGGMSFNLVVGWLLGALAASFVLHRGTAA